MDQLSIVAVLQISYLVQRKWFFRPEGNGSIQLAFNNFLITNFFSVVLLLIAQEHDFIKLSPKSPPKSPKIGSIVKSEFFWPEVGQNWMENLQKPTVNWTEIACKWQRQLQRELVKTWTKNWPKVTKKLNKIVIKIQSKIHQKSVNNWEKIDEKSTNNWLTTDQKLTINSPKTDQNSTKTNVKSSKNRPKIDQISTKID